MCLKCSWTCVSLWTHPRIQWANITYPCLGFALTPQQRSKHNTHRTPRSHRQHNNTSTNNSQQNPPKKNQQEQKNTARKLTCVFFVCVCAAFLILLSSFTYLYLPMVLGSEVSWLSSTFKVVSFFNIPAITHVVTHVGAHKDLRSRQTSAKLSKLRVTYTVRQVLQHVGGEQQVL